MHPHDLGYIYNLCCANNIDLAQALSIRSALLRAAVPWRFEVTYAQEEAAIAFELVVANFLRSRGVMFKTQEEQTADAYAKRAANNKRGGGGGGGGGGGIGPTPDFLINDDCALFINGKRIRYIEVKRFYGIGLTEGLKQWSPSLKIVAQAEKYAKVFGEDGAFIIQHGYAEAFRDRLPRCIQLLDAGPFIDEVEASNKEEVQRQLNLGQVPHGRTGEAARDDYADSIWNANMERRRSVVRLHHKY